MPWTACDAPGVGHPGPRVLRVLLETRTVVASRCQRMITQGDMGDQATSTWISEGVLCTLAQA